MVSVSLFSGFLPSGDLFLWCNLAELWHPSSRISIKRSNGREKEEGERVLWHKDGKRKKQVKIKCYWYRVVGQGGGGTSHWNPGPPNLCPTTSTPLLPQAYPFSYIHLCLWSGELSRRWEFIFSSTNFYYMFLLKNLILIGQLQHLAVKYFLYNNRYRVYLWLFHGCHITSYFLYSWNSKDKSVLIDLFNF